MEWRQAWGRYIVGAAKSTLLEFRVGVRIARETGRQIERTEAWAWRERMHNFVGTPGFQVRMLVLKATEGSEQLREQVGSIGAWNWEHSQGGRSLASNRFLLNFFPLLSFPPPVGYITQLNLKVSTLLTDFYCVDAFLKMIWPLNQRYREVFRMSSTLQI